MDTSASSYPIHRSYSNTYYPDIGFQTYPEHRKYGYEGLGYQNAYPFTENRFFRGFHNRRYFPQFYQPSGFERKYFYDKDLKALNDFERAGGNKGEQVYRDIGGYKDNNSNLKNTKSNLGRYNEEAEKKISEEDKNLFKENNRFNQQGIQENHKNQNALHKKGHVVKGFKKHHHKDEDSKNEEYYDESHDEGGNTNYGGHSGSFANNAANSLQGGHNNKNYKAVDKNLGGHYQSGQHLDSSDGDRKQFFENQRRENTKAFDFKTDTNQHSLLENQELSKVYKHHPYIFPFIYR
ncbi:hypothetical protein RN001_004512 [Aquatica leii]|uniref:Uncharacterized protein n=1 Tax=Aquatica leii TaxID=1421715 RepID=A0AAN7QJM2_9COLE|nr:hypothetical protein RN001_004512 [Aquatica leii]